MANFSVACLPPVLARAMLLTFLLLLVAAAAFIIVVVVVVAAAFYVSFSRMRRRLTRFQRTSA